MNEIIVRHRYVTKMGNIVSILLILSLLIFFIVGWVSNINKLSELELNKQGSECIVRGSGIVIFPIGSILGYINFNK